MNTRIDEYAHLSSPLHRWEQRTKLIGLLALIFAFSYVRDLRMLCAMVAITAVIYLVSRLPASFALGRLRYPSFFLLAVVFTLPFLSGQTVVASIGPLELRLEGLLGVLLIAIRFLCILTLGFVLFGTASFLTTINAMRGLGLPAILADMVLLSFRYLHEIGGHLRRMQTAMRQRGFIKNSFSMRGFRILAWIAGSILVQSYEQSERIYKAMILRGYGQAPHPPNEFKIMPRDAIALAAFLLLSAGFIAGDILLGHETATLLQ